MAYRKLVEGDLVRITNGGEYHGRDAIVIDAEKQMARVQVRIGRGGEMSAECLWVRNDNLLVREDNQVTDGRIDDVKVQRLLDARNRRTQQEHDDDEDDDKSEACGDCPCCNWHNRNY